jgi:glyoxylase-like metal-dependent hydrolase (beta-lactamase superfamily II)
MVKSLRSSLAATVAAVFVAAASISTGAEEFAPPARPAKLSKSQAGFYRIRIGDVDVTALSDGTLPLDAALLQGDAKKISALLKRGFLESPMDGSVNAFLIDAGNSRLILVDAGTGTLFGPTANKLPASLRAAGYQPEQITDILITHVHTDHTGGLFVDGKRIYPNAVVHLERKEMDYWLDPAKMAVAREDQKHFFAEADKTLRPYVTAGRVQPFDGATELFPGIRSQPSPGHTPGHSFYVLESKGEKIVFWGDLIHVAQVQLEDPSVTIQFDTDPAAAAAQRKRSFADAAAQHYLVAPAHVSFPGFGRFRREGSVYRWYPVPYLNDAHTGSN